MVLKKIVFTFIIVILALSIVQPSWGYFSIEDRIRIALYHYDNKAVQNQKFTEDGNLNFGIPVLLYHGIVKEPDGVNISWDTFIEQMEALKKAGYETIDINELSAFLNGEDIILPEKPIVITFDDGRKDSYYYSDFVFKELGFKAVMFVAVNKQIEQDPFFLSWEELNKMQASGRWDIQSHGKRAHEFIIINSYNEEGKFASNFKWLPEEERWETLKKVKDRLAQDYRMSKEILEEKVQGANVIAYAYPFGDFGQRQGNFRDLSEMNLDSVSDYYQLAFGPNSNNPKLGFSVYPNDKNLYTIKRLEVNSEWNGKELVAILKESRLVQL